MSDPKPGRTEVLATNLWFGSEHATRLSAGTAALEEIYARYYAVSRHYVDNGAGSAILHGIRDFDRYREELGAIRNHLAARRPDRVILLGGGCAASVPVIAYLRSVHPRLRVLWLDAHGDLNVPQTSRSGYLHGMAVGMLVDPSTYGLFFSDGLSLSCESLALGGQKALDPGELMLIAGRRIATLGPDEPPEAFMKRFLLGAPPPAVYVHVDLDVLHPEVSHNPTCTVAAGLDLDRLAEILTAVADSSRVVGYAVAENFETDPRRLAGLSTIFHVLLP